MKNMGTVFHDLIAAFVVSLVAISFYVSCAAMLFPGALASHIPLAIGMALLGGVCMALIAAWQGSISRASVGPEPATVPVVAGITGAIALQCSPEAAMPTALVTMAISSILVGAVWLVIGARKSGNAIRYLPYPVIGGFLASVGWLMLSGGLVVVIGKPPSLAWLAGVLNHPAQPLLISSTLVAAAFWLVTQRSKHIFVIPGLIMTSSLAIHGWLQFSALDIESARRDGWLMHSFELATPSFTFRPDILEAIDWTVLIGHWGGFVSVILVSTIALLLSNSSLEVAFDEEADFNRDLKVLGLGNILLGAFGGVVSGISISRSVLNVDAGARSRMSGVFKAAICLLAMIFGGPLLALIPKPVLAGILIFMGFAMLKAWLVDARSRLGRSDYLVVLSMVLITIVAGYLPAVFAGVIFCCFDFAFISARLGSVRRISNRNAWPGRVERGLAEKQALEARGSEVMIVELQGVLFFGSIRELSLKIESTELASNRPIRQILLDFRRVLNIDSSAAVALARIIKKSAKAEVEIVFSGVSRSMEKILAVNGCLPAGIRRLFTDIDQAVVSWEEGILASLQNSAAHDFKMTLDQEFGDAVLAERLLGYLETIQLDAGNFLFRKGDVSDALFWIQSGRLAAVIDPEGKNLHLFTFQTGGTVGEMGVFRDVARSADILAEENSTLQMLTRSRLKFIEENDHELAIHLHRLFVRLLATRLDYSNRQIEGLVA